MGLTHPVEHIFQNCHCNRDWMNSVLPDPFQGQGPSNHIVHCHKCLAIKALFPEFQVESCLWLHYRMLPVSSEKGIPRFFSSYILSFAPLLWPCCNTVSGPQGAMRAVIRILINTFYVRIMWISARYWYIKRVYLSELIYSLLSYWRKIFTWSAILNNNYLNGSLQTDVNL